MNEFSPATREFLATPYAARKRIKPMEVLCLGMSRTGTESMVQALHQLGYDHVCHGYDIINDPSSYALWTSAMESHYLGKGQIWGREDWDKLLGHCQAVTDQPCICYPYDLIQCYPEAKVVLTTRDTDAWYDSYRQTIEATMNVSWWQSFEARFDFQANFLFNSARKRQLIFWEGSFERNGKRRYEEHNALIRGLVPKENLLEYKVEEGWEKLCKFLDKPIPKTAFPSGNTPTSFMLRVRDFTSGCRRRARQNMAVSGAVGVLCLTVIYQMVVGRAGFEKLFARFRG